VSSGTLNLTQPNSPTGEKQCRRHSVFGPVHLCESVRPKNLVNTLSQKLMKEISPNFSYWCIWVRRSADYLLGSKGQGHSKQWPEKNGWPSTIISPQLGHVYTWVWDILIRSREVKVTAGGGVTVVGSPSSFVSSSFSSAFARWQHRCCVIGVNVLFWSLQVVSVM